MRGSSPHSTITQTPWTEWLVRAGPSAAEDPEVISFQYPGSVGAGPRQVATEQGPQEAILKELSRHEGLRLLHGLATNLATSLQTPQEA